MSSIDIGSKIEGYMDKLGCLCLFCCHPITKDEMSKSAGNFQLIPHNIKISFGEIQIKKVDKIFAVCGKCFSHSDMRMKMMMELFSTDLDFQDIQEQVLRQLKLKDLKASHEREIAEVLKENKDVAKN